MLQSVITAVRYGMAAPRLSSCRRYFGWTYRELAERLDVCVTTAHGLCNGTRRPGLALALRIETVTAAWVHGPVRGHEWLTGEGAAA